MLVDGAIADVWHAVSLSAGDDVVIRAVVHSDGASVPLLLITDSDGSQRCDDLLRLPGALVTSSKAP